MPSHPLIKQIEDMGITVDNVYRYNKEFFGIKSPWGAHHTLFYLDTSRKLLYQTQSMSKEMVEADKPLVIQIRVLALLNGFSTKGVM